jgi:GntR family transcriptional repressor for pyruvate dehydrogenase complex
MVHRVPLQRLRTVPVKEQVIEVLKRRIKDGTWQPGDQLPSERELSERLGVSRGTVREAVQLLGALGVLEVRRGSGTFVRSYANDAEFLHSTWRNWTAHNSDRIRELLEVRQGIESLAAELAAVHRDAASLQAMADAIKQMRMGARAQDVPALVEADLLFHRALVAASGNRTLAELADALGMQLVRERAATWALHGRSELSLAEHTAIYEGVRRGDGAYARAAVIAHLTTVAHDVEQITAEARMSDRTHETAPSALICSALGSNQPTTEGF